MLEWAGGKYRETTGDRPHLDPKVMPESRELHMSFLKAESPIDVQKAVQAVEYQADKCYEELSLLSRPRNEAIWALLTGTIDQLEHEMSRWGSHSQEFLAAITNLGRTVPVVRSWIERHGESESTSIRKYRWTPSLRTGVGNALVATHQYAAF
jgi:hypothetical protein